MVNAAPCNVPSMGHLGKSSDLNLTAAAVNKKSKSVGDHPESSCDLVEQKKMKKIEKRC